MNLYYDDMDHSISVTPEFQKNFGAYQRNIARKLGLTAACFLNEIFALQADMRTSLPLSSVWIEFNVDKAQELTGLTAIEQHHVICSLMDLDVLAISLNVKTGLTEFKINYEKIEEILNELD